MESQRNADFFYSLTQEHRMLMCSDDSIYSIPAYDAFCECHEKSA